MHGIIIADKSTDCGVTKLAALLDITSFETKMFLEIHIRNYCNYGIIHVD